jgi:tRNA (guanine-N7-)-methyltransferase
VVLASQPQVEWSEIFANARPVEIEIGPGKGGFLLAYARHHPETNLLGIENQPRWARWIGERLSRAPQANVRVLCADASLVVSHFVRENSVQAYHLYFPDPWWKRRHHKRRLVQSDFAVEVWRTLATGGALYLATDVRERFEAMIGALSRVPFAIVRASEPTPPGRPLTNFERKYQEQDRRLYYATFTKMASGFRKDKSKPSAKT